MKRTLIILSLFVVLIGVLIVTNPSDDLIKLEAEQFAVSELKNKMSTRDVNHKLVENLMIKAIESGIRIDDYYVFKVVNLSFGGKIRTLGYGYLGSFHPSSNA